LLGGRTQGWRWNFATDYSRSPLKSKTAGCSSYPAVIPRPTKNSVLKSPWCSNGRTPLSKIISAKLRAEALEDAIGCVYAENIPLDLGFDGQHFLLS